MAHCRYCFDRRRNEIDLAYLQNTPVRTIVAQFGGSLGAASRHRKHIQQMLQERSPREREEHGENLSSRAEALLSEGQELLRLAKSREDIRGAVAAINGCVRVLELIGRATGELQAPGFSSSVHFRSTKNINIVNEQNSDREIAFLVGEATANFDLEEFLRLKELAEQSSTPVSDG